SEPCCLVAFVVDLREAADLAAVCLGLVQGGGRHDGAGQAVAADRVVQVDFVDRGSLVGEGDGKAGVAHLADAAGSSGCCGQHGGGLRGVPLQDAADRLHVLGREGVDGSAEQRAQVVGGDLTVQSGA